jgi:hypothetical protein
MMTFNNIRIKTWTPWTPWTPFHSVNKYFKNDVHEEHLQFKKDFIQKIYFFNGVWGVQGVHPVRYDNGWKEENEI